MMKTFVLVKIDEYRQDVDKIVEVIKNLNFEHIVTNCISDGQYEILFSSETGSHVDLLQHFHSVKEVHYSQEENKECDCESCSCNQQQ